MAVNEASLIDETALPLATPATADLVCWLRAAYPPKEGRGINEARVNTGRLAQILEVSPRTIQRWLAKPDDLVLNRAALTRLRRYAILRGHGTILWPEHDPGTARRIANLAQKSRRSWEISKDSELVPADDPKMTNPCTVLQYHAPEAMVIGIATGEPKERKRKLKAQGAVIIDEVTVPNYYAAQVIKYAALELAGTEVCLPPRTLLPTGRTEVWRIRAGSVDLRSLAREQQISWTDV